MNRTSRWALGRWVVLAGVMVLVGGVAAAMVTKAMPAQYESSVTYILDGATGPDQTESAGRTVQALLTGDAMAEAVLITAGVPLSVGEFSANLDVARPPASAVIEVTYTDQDPARAETIIQTLDPVFQAKLAVLAKKSQATSEQYAVALWSDPEAEAKRVPPPLLINTAIGLILGGMVGVAVFSIAWGRSRDVSPDDPVSESSGRSD